MAAKFKAIRLFADSFETVEKVVSGPRDECDQAEGQPARERTKTYVTDAGCSDNAVSHAFIDTLKAIRLFADSFFVTLFAMSTYDDIGDILLNIKWG